MVHEYIPVAENKIIRLMGISKTVLPQQFAKI